ncbi:MAG: trehalose-phosphatase [Dehalococcoidia bacterium]|nr:trehalose-phosphatase [Dehalococcoidia bacterium]
MPYLFDHVESVRRFLRSAPLGLFTDIDGTISKIERSSAEAEVTPACRESLAILVQRLALVAAVSGRRVADSIRMVGLEGMVYIGNHGYEICCDGRFSRVPGVDGYAAEIRRLLERLSENIPAGVVISDKEVTAAIHYRRCPDPERARQAILAALLGPARDAGLRISQGKMVLEIRPPLEVNKGTAVVSLAIDRNLRSLVYLGDDVTDVEAFVALHRPGLPFKALAIGVTDDEESPPGMAGEVDYTLNGVEDVERLLRLAVEEATGRPAS